MSLEIRWKRMVEHAAFPARDSAGWVLFDETLCLLGGWTPKRVNDVWCSEDGVNWKQVIEHAPWEERNLPCAVVFDDKIWLYGGGSDSGSSHTTPDYHCHADVWRTKDGRNWTCVVENAPWHARSSATAVVHDDRMWILGGLSGYRNPEHYADVWCSADGKQWEQVTPAAPWGTRAMHSSVVFKDRMWVIGGGHYHDVDTDHADVWCSSDGADWTCVTGAAPWTPRRFHESIVYDDAIWVVGGVHNDGMPPYNRNDVWCSRDGKNWIEANHHAPWAIRHAMALYVFKDKLWLVNGCGEDAARDKYDLVYNDVWTYARPGS